MAETFNKFFTTIAEEIASLINPTLPETNDDNPMQSTHTDNPNNDNDIRFNTSDFPVTSDEIITCFNLLEDKKTPDVYTEFQNYATTLDQTNFCSTQTRRNTYSLHHPQMSHASETIY
jgi:hypothetical protein